MDILVVGSGGREHAIIWKIRQSSKVNKIYCAPGNGGISNIAECVDIDAMDIKGVVKFSKDNKIDMVVVAPDDPLSIGMVDELVKEGIKAIGPTKEAAILEWSKSFSKNFMKRNAIPTAEYEVFNNSDKAIEYLKGSKFPIVIKADGLALGKGVFIVNNYNEGLNAIKTIMTDKVFGKAGREIVIEEYLEGQEITILAFTDSNIIVPMVSSQDYKRAYDNDEGPNTGGMGTFSPSEIYTKELESECINKIFMPTLQALNVENITYKGILYFGLIKTNSGVKVIEYNSRFGDPEAQVVIPRLESDLVEIFDAIYNEKLSEINIKWNKKAAICLIAASGGYPLKYKKGYKIFGLDDVDNEENTIVFHAGTRIEDGKYLTNGGRILGVTVLNENFELARENAYKIIKKINFEGMHYRNDIGLKNIENKR
ncbi:MAG: phosphoribosylamine--glycine ligase [Clostridiales bacterium]